MEVRRVDWLRYLRRKCTGDVNLHVTQKMLSALMIEDYMAMVTYLIESCDLHEDVSMQFFYCFFFFLFLIGNRHDCSLQWIGYCLMEEVVSILKVNVDPKHHHHPLWDYMLFSSRQWQSSALKKGALHYCDALSCKQLPRLEDCHSLAEMFAEVKRWRLTLNIH